MKKGNKKSSNFILILILVIGLSLLLYPSVSDYWNSIYQSQAIEDYTNLVSDMGEDRSKVMMGEAIRYNQEIAKHPQTWVMTDEEREKYNATLDVSGTGVMGYIEIESINVYLPIYHSVEESVLQTAIGHIEGSSLPVGGASSHCVISGHRGLPSAKLFSSLDKMVEGDIFVLKVLDEEFTYEVDQIRIVEPEDISEIMIEQGKDLVTLVTCTPYGVNTHRLLVRGHRIENLAEELVITAEAIAYDSLLVATIVAIPVLLILTIAVLVKTSYRKVGRSDGKKA